MPLAGAHYTCQHVVLLVGAHCIPKVKTKLGECSCTLPLAPKRYSVFAMSRLVLDTRYTVPKHERATLQHRSQKINMWNCTRWKVQAGSGTAASRMGLYLSASVGKDNRLGDGQGLEEIAENIDLELFLSHVHVELLDTFQSELIPLYENADRLVHELLCDLKSFRGKRS